jgi:hypothetical protein
MDRGRVGEDRGSKETDGCPLTLSEGLLSSCRMGMSGCKVGFLLAIDQWWSSKTDNDPTGLSIEKNYSIFVILLREMLLNGFSVL